MKKIIFIMFAFMALFQVNAQKEETETVFAPIGAKWYYKVMYSNFAPDWYNHAMLLLEYLIQTENKRFWLFPMGTYNCRLRCS